MKFDFNYYRNMYFDLKDLSNKELVEHFRKFGMWEGRICSKQFLRHKQDKNFKKLYEVSNFLDNLSEEILNKEEQIINIIIRTHNRPNFFKLNLNSIKEQNYANHILYITYENEETLNYILENTKEMNNIKLINVTKNNEEVFYNLYCNTVLEIIKDGYNMFLDDDDMLTHKNALKYINSFLLENRFLCWEYMRADKIIGPRKNKVKCGEIVSCGFCYHNSHKSLWTPTEDGDHIFAKNLIENNDLTIGKIKSILTRSISMEVIQGQGLGNDFDEDYERKRYVEDFIEEIIDTTINNLTKKDKGNDDEKDDDKLLDTLFGLKKEDGEKEDVKKEDGEKEKMVKEDVKKEDVKKEEMVKEDVKKEEMVKEDVKKEKERKVVVNNNLQETI